MAALGFAMLGLGALLIYAGMTGDSLPRAVQRVLTGDTATDAPATPPATAPAGGGTPAPAPQGGGGGGSRR